MKIKKMTDEECLEKFLELLENRIEITTGFIRDPVTGNITHQVIQVKCGELVSVSQPEQLDVILRVATAAEQDQLVN